MKNNESYPLPQTSEWLASASQNPAVSHRQELQFTFAAASRQLEAFLMFLLTETWSSELENIRQNPSSTQSNQFSHLL